MTESDTLPKMALRSVFLPIRGHGYYVTLLDLSDSNDLLRRVARCDRRLDVDAVIGEPFFDFLQVASACEYLRLGAFIGCDYRQQQHWNIKSPGDLRCVRQDGLCQL